MYGFTEGINENIHELINNESMLKFTYYGDILILKISPKKIVSIDCNEYEQIFNSYFIENKDDFEKTDLNIEYSDSETSSYESESEEYDSEDTTEYTDDESYISNNEVVETIENENKNIRTNIKKLFSNILDNDDTVKLEENIYTYCIEFAEKNKINPSLNNKIFKNIYINKCRSIYSNIDSILLIIQIF